MSNPDAFANSQAPLPDLPTEDLSNGTLPPDAEQPETQGDEPQEAELGENGQGDLDADDRRDASDEPRDLRGGAE